MLLYFHFYRGCNSFSILPFLVTAPSCLRLPTIAHSQSMWSSGTKSISSSKMCLGRRPGHSLDQHIAVASLLSSGPGKSELISGILLELLTKSSSIVSEMVDVRLALQMAIFSPCRNARLPRNQHRGKQSLGKERHRSPRTSKSTRFHSRYFRDEIQEIPLGLNQYE